MKINQFFKQFKLERLLGMSKSRRLRNTPIKGNRGRQNERGFALPLVIGIGLLMLLLGITTVVQSQSSQINSSIQKKTAEVSEVAEIGVSRMQTFFAANRRLALASLYDIGTTNSWEQANNFLPATCSGSTTTIPLTQFQKDQWINITAGSTQYRVVGYDYTPSGSPSSNLIFTSINISTTDTVSTVKPLTFLAPLSPPSPAYIGEGASASVNGQIAGVFGTLTRTGSAYTFTLLSVPTAPVSGTVFYPMSETGTGRLRVEGRVINGSNTIASSGLQVEIPVYPGGTENFPVPGIWIGGKWNPDSNNWRGTIAGAALINCNTGKSLVNAVDPTKIYQRPAALPDLRPIPSTATLLRTNSSVAGVTAAILLPRNSDLPTLINDTQTWGSSPKVYEYKIELINFSGSEAITIDPNYKVNIYLTGNFSKGGSIDHDSALSGSALGRDITCAGSSTTAGTCKSVYKPSDFKLYGYGTTSTTTPPEICVNGNRILEGFILAPKYAVGRTGNATFKGAIWAGEFNTPSTCSSANDSPFLTQTGTWDDFDGYQPLYLPPAIAPIKTWTKRDAS